jgi:hypothetical protein
MTPHPQVKEDMDRFMREFAINFEGKHQTAARRVIVIPALGVHGHGRAGHSRNGRGGGRHEHPTEHRPNSNDTHRQPPPIEAARTSASLAVMGCRFVLAENASPIRRPLV